MLGGMHVHIYSRRIKLKKQHKSRMAPMEKDIAIRLSNGV
jgi:hypothetical protein